MRGGSFRQGCSLILNTFHLRQDSSRARGKFLTNLLQSPYRPRFLTGTLQLNPPRKKITTARPSTLRGMPHSIVRCRPSCFIFAVVDKVLASKHEARYGPFWCVLERHKKRASSAAAGSPSFPSVDSVLSMPEHFDLTKRARRPLT